MFKRNTTLECIFTADPSSKAGGTYENIFKRRQNTAQAEEKGKTRE